MKKFLAVLALLASTSLAHAEEKKTWQLYGLFCNDVESLNVVIDNIDAMGFAAIEMVNKDKQTCTFFDGNSPNRVVADKVKMLSTRQDRIGKLYLYEANVTGYLFFPLLRPAEPPVTQYFYTQNVLSGTVKVEAL